MYKISDIYRGPLQILKPTKIEKENGKKIEKFSIRVI